MRAELQQVLEVLGEWQHYGRVRNAHFEEIFRAYQGEKALNNQLRRQVSASCPALLGAERPTRCKGHSKGHNSGSLAPSSFWRTPFCAGLP